MHRIINWNKMSKIINPQLYSTILALGNYFILGGGDVPPEEVGLVLASVGSQVQTPGSHLTHAILPCWLGQQYYSEVEKVENIGICLATKLQNILLRILVKLKTFQSELARLN